MVTTPRLCARCQKPLSLERAAKRKKYCYTDERSVKKEQKEAAHDHRVERMYGLRPGEYKKLYEAQGERCAIKNCKARGVSIRLAVEHDHNKGFTREAIRGLMCKTHNKWIGWSGDDPEVFESIAAYLRNPPAQKILEEA